MELWPGRRPSDASSSCVGTSDNRVTVAGIWFAVAVAAGASRDAAGTFMLAVGALAPPAPLSTSSAAGPPLYACACSEFTGPLSLKWLLLLFATVFVAEGDDNEEPSAFAGKAASTSL